jgi:hypothetical protein
MPAASELATQRLTTAFALPTDRTVTGDPRDDVLSWGEPLERVQTARAALLGAALGIALMTPSMLRCNTRQRGETVRPIRRS